MKKIALLAILCVASLSSFSQITIKNGLGLSYLSYKAQDMPNNRFIGFAYSIYFCFLERDNMSVSAGLPVSIGLRIKNHASAFENDELAVLVNVPVVVNLNIGAGSSDRSKSRFGFFAGGGFGYNYKSGTDDLVDDEETGEYRLEEKKTLGPVGDAGVRIAVGRGGSNIELKGLYMKGITGSKADIIGISTLFSF